MGVQKKERKTQQYMNIAIHLPEAHHSSYRIIKYFRHVLSLHQDKGLTLSTSRLSLQNYDALYHICQMF